MTTIKAVCCASASAHSTSCWWAILKNNPKHVCCNCIKTGFPRPCWLRRITANDPERQKNALEFQRTVDKIFSFGGFRGEADENPIHLARKFRSLAGFSDDEITDLVDTAAEAYEEARAMQAANAPA